MPRVGSFTFPYTKEGMEAARRTSRMMGSPVINENEKDYELDNTLYSSIGNNLDTAFNTGIDNRGGPRTMSTPGLSAPKFDTGSTTKENFPWENTPKLGGNYG